MFEKKINCKERACSGFYHSFFQIFKVAVTSKFILPFLIVLLFPGTTLAEGVIGLDTTFTINPINFLTSNPEYAQAFNYFFTLELFVGLFAFWARITIRPFRM